ncbi:hypothetical protein I5P92_14165 [Serratia ureilytica]|uniref:hypothetical protein n=1 Tax=Serratia TaxID=613 RepID=UPI0015F2ACC5|nr:MULTISPECIES: hypothetical protein [Serratia]MBH3108765.1 hypothetical protein [Serratia ureilytica]MBH3123690.1 hypothetical protein [Serratia ureilytica]MBH3156906.1 hypothetical protein [Serratia ureilytica]MBH3252018.1 hypothetical protein [Serratia ureilytica]
MKARICNLLRRWRFPALAGAALMGCAASGYFMFAKPRMPECRAMVRIVNQEQGKTLTRVLLLSVVPDGPRQMTLLLNGSLSDGDTRYTIDRIVRMEYRFQGGNYLLQIKENIKKPQDSLKQEALNRRLPMVGQHLHVRIEQLDRRHYLFVDNHSPLFVCTSS